MVLNYLIIILLFSLWISMQERKGISTILGLSTIACMILFLTQVYTCSMSMADQMGLMAVSMILLAIYSSLYTIIKSSLGRVCLLVTGLWAGHTVINQQAVISALSYDPSAEIIVKIDSNFKRSIEEALEDYSYQLIPAFTPTDADRTTLDDYYTINIHDDDAYDIPLIEHRLSSIAGINDIAWNTSYTPEIIPGSTPTATQRRYRTNDPLRPQQWGLDLIGHDKMLAFIVNQNLKPTKQVNLFILDTGIEANHEDISPIYNSLLSLYDLDIKGHGTHCAGIAGAASDNAIGITGIIPSSEWATVTSIKVLGDNGFGTRKQILEGMITAVDEGAEVISLSLGGLSLFGSAQLYNDAVDYANAKRAIIVVAAGNSSSNAIDYTPANTRSSITVTAVDRDRNIASFSNTVENIDMAVAAPGVDILSTFPNNKYQTFSGTSMATPHVAGLLAVMKALEPQLTVDQAYTILDQTGINSNNTRLTGKIIQPEAAVRRLIERR